MATSSGPQSDSLAGQPPDESLSARVRANPLWYHTIELAPGVVTPGWFDLRPVRDCLPWPDVQGKRCLDVGTYDGYFAFELERRGASEVVATDISDHTQWDWPPDARERDPELLAQIAGPEKGLGFAIAKEALSSVAEHVEVSVYDLSPVELGTFDVIVCGALLLHLRDPFRALEAIRSVCGGQFLSAEQIDASLTLAHPRRPVYRLNAIKNVQWSIPNAAAHRRMIHAAGFEIEHASRPYAVPFGVGHHEVAWNRRRVAGRLLTGGGGVPYAAILAHRRV